MNVTRKNFAVMLPMIEAAIKEADIIAYDFEMTGITY